MPEILTHEDLLRNKVTYALIQLREVYVKPVYMIHGQITATIQV